MLDSKALAAATALIIKEHVAAATAPLMERIAQLEQRSALTAEDLEPIVARQIEAAVSALPAPERGEKGDAGDKGDRGDDADPEAVRAIVAELAEPIVQRQVEAAVSALPAPERGEKGDAGDKGDRGDDADPEAVRAIVAELAEPIVARQVEAAVSALPAPERGEKGDAGDKGDRGDDADPEAVRAIVAEMVEPIVERQVQAAVSALPAPERGEKGDAGEKGDRGDDGVGLADMLIDRAGELVATMTDGRMRNLGLVVGRDGDAGKAGRDAPGPGDFDMTLLEDGRTLRIAISREGDETEYAFKVCLPIPVDRGVHQAGKSYEDGDVVTFDGALWIAQRDTNDAPGTGDAWRNMIPKPADGAPGYAGEAKGLWSEDGQYRAMDVVSLNGSEWRAKRDNPGALPGEGWMLSAVKGKRGERGDKGDAGRATPAIVASYIDPKTMRHVITLENGAEVEADLAPLVDRIIKSIEGTQHG